MRPDQVATDAPLKASVNPSLNAPASPRGKGLSRCHATCIA